MQKGVSMAFVPEDRLGMGLVASMDMADNMHAARLPEQQGRPLWTANRPGNWRSRLIERAGDRHAQASIRRCARLSGGNVQKVLLGREIACNPPRADHRLSGARTGHQLLLYASIDLLNEQKQKGRSRASLSARIWMCCWSSCDRILVLCGGQVSGIVDPRTTSPRKRLAC